MDNLDIPLGMQAMANTDRQIDIALPNKNSHTGNILWLRSTNNIPWVWVTTMDVFNPIHVYTTTKCLYHDSMSKPWFHVNTMIPCQYIESMCIPWLYHESISTLSIPWVNVYTMSPFPYNESMSIPWVHVYTMSPCPYHESMSIQWVNVNAMR